MPFLGIAFAYRALPARWRAAWRSAGKHFCLCLWVLAVDLTGISRDGGNGDMPLWAPYELCARALGELGRRLRLPLSTSGCLRPSKAGDATEQRPSIFLAASGGAWRARREPRRTAHGKSGRKGAARARSAWRCAGGHSAAAFRWRERSSALVAAFTPRALQQGGTLPFLCSVRVSKLAVLPALVSRRWATNGRTLGEDDPSADTSCCIPGFCWLAQRSAAWHFAMRHAGTAPDASVRLACARASAFAVRATVTLRCCVLRICGSVRLHMAATLGYKRRRPSHIGSLARRRLFRFFSRDGQTTAWRVTEGRTGACGDR